MSTMQASLERLKPLWLSAWPLLALVVFASLAGTRWLPGGYARAAVAAPILMVPGYLTLGAIFGHDSRPRGSAFICYSALLSVIWLGFSSLALYLLIGRITADDMYWSLLVICAVLATVAQARLELGRSATSSRATGGGESLNPDPPGLQNLAAPLYPLVAGRAGLNLPARGGLPPSPPPPSPPCRRTTVALGYPH